MTKSRRQLFVVLLTSAVALASIGVFTQDSFCALVNPVVEAIPPDPVIGEEVQIRATIRVASG